MPLIKMERYTLQQRIEIVKIHYKNSENFAETVRKVNTFLGCHEAPSRPAIVKLVKKFELLGQVSNVKNRTRARRARTSLDFFLWNYVKYKVYADSPQSIQELKEKICAVIDELEPKMCENVMDNFIKRAWSCKRSRGGHINDIVFHY